MPKKYPEIAVGAFILNESIEQALKREVREEQEYVWIDHKKAIKNLKMDSFVTGILKEYFKK